MNVRNVGFSQACLFGLLVTALSGCKNPFAATPAPPAVRPIPKEPAAICAALQARVNSAFLKDQARCAKELGEMRQAFPAATWEKLTICLDKGTDEQSLDDCVKVAMSEAAEQMH